MSDREENWQVIMMRCDSADALEFEVRFLRLGSEVMIWPVPAPAKQDLANVFVQGGSFLRSTMNHMAAEWSKVQLSHPHLYSIYEQECLGITAMPAGAPSTGPKWHRLTL